MKYGSVLIDDQSFDTQRNLATDFSGSEMDDFLLERRALKFILRMTSGVVYTIVMHVLFITAYTLLTFRIFYKKGFDPRPVS